MRMVLGRSGIPGLAKKKSFTDFFANRLLAISFLLATYFLLELR